VFEIAKHQQHERQQSAYSHCLMQINRNYRSDIGMLLYLVKHSRPVISNANRKISKVGKGATLAHGNHLLRAIKDTIKKKNKALNLKPKMNKIYYVLY
jgi:hypothetical protein